MRHSPSKLPLLLLKVPPGSKRQHRQYDSGGQHTAAGCCSGGDPRGLGVSPVAFVVLLERLSGALCASKNDESNRGSGEGMVINLLTDQAEGH